LLVISGWLTGGVGAYSWGCIMADQTVTTSEVDWALLVELNTSDDEYMEKLTPVVYEFPNGRKFKRPEDPYNG